MILKILFQKNLIKILIIAMKSYWSGVLKILQNFGALFGILVK